MTLHQRWSDVNDVASTLSRRCINVMCPLGFFKQSGQKPSLNSSLHVSFSHTVDSRYLEVQGTLWSTLKYPYPHISDLQNWGKINWTTTFYKWCVNWLLSLWFPICLPIYRRTSMARTPLGPWKFVRDSGSSSHGGLLLLPYQEA